MRNWTDSELESLHELAAGKHGWLSKLQQTMNVSPEEEAYLVWLDEHARLAQDQIAAWEQEIESHGGKDIYFEENEGKQFALLTHKINELEGQLDPDLLNRMARARYKLKMGLMRRIEPEVFVGITDLQIERARNYPLWRLMGLPHKKNILCPFHKEKSPSFNVGIWGWCYTCKRHQDSIGYLMTNRLLTFSQAVTDLANR